MPTDNTQLNTGTGGNTLRTLADGSSIEWPVAVATYATTVSAGANVLQVVTPSNPLPVAASQSGTWSVTVVDSVALLVGAQQSGSWTVGVTGSVAVTGTFWQATQPISAAALPLPAGAAADASVNGILVAQASTTSGQTGPLVQGACTTAAPTYTTAKTAPLSLDTAGNLRTLDSTTNGILVAQGSATAGEKGPLVQGAVTTAAPSYTTGQTSPFSLDTAGNLRVLASQSGTFTVQPGNTANTTPWLANPSDPAATTGSITVVDSGISSASGQGGQSILTGTPTASSSVSATLTGQTMVSLQVAGTWTGTLSFERSIDGGTTYVPMSMLLYSVSGPTIGSITANAILHTTIGGNTQIRVRATAAMTGTASVTIKPSYGEAMAVSLPAGLNTQQSGSLTGTPLYAKITASASGATTIVGATAGKQIVILRWSLSANGNVNMNWQSHATTATATGLHYMTQYSTAGGAYCPAGIFATAAGEALDINLSGAVAVGGELTYILM